MNKEDAIESIQQLKDLKFQGIKHPKIGEEIVQLGKVVVTIKHGRKQNKGQHTITLTSKK